MVKKNQGFTILELAIVVSVIALIAGAALSIGASRVLQARIDDTDAKMELIQDALKAFVSEFGYLPCPAGTDTPPDNVDFGKEQRIPQAGCDDQGGSSIIKIDNNKTLPAVDAEIFIGSVPVKTLNLEPAVMLDGWDRRITYFVAGNMVLNSAFGSADPDGEPEDNDYIIIRSSSAGDDSNEITDKAVLALISHGPNGNGAWRAKGGKIDNSVSSNNDELENGDMNNRTLVQKFRTEEFDDTVKYMMHWQLAN